MNGYRNNYKYSPRFACWESLARGMPQKQQAQFLGEIIDTCPGTGKIQDDPEHLKMPKIKEMLKKKKKVDNNMPKGHSGQLCPMAKAGLI